MLKSVRSDQTRFVSQPDHASISGYLAAHWGNAQFAPPGHFARCDNSRLLRSEVLFAISQHDNGWWEWEASPELGNDGLPLGLSDLLKDRQAGMERWRRGIDRFRQNHDYASLLISWHAYWLYAPSIDTQATPPLHHPLFGDPDDSENRPDELQVIKSFLEELEGRQHQLVMSVESESSKAPWLTEAHLWPHVRLLQMLDGLSLAICSDLVVDEHDLQQAVELRSFELPEIPRASWQDRVTIGVTFENEHCLRLTPYPFDIEPLPVAVPTKIFSNAESRDDLDGWHRCPMAVRKVVLVGGE